MLHAEKLDWWAAALLFGSGLVYRQIKPSPIYTWAQPRGNIRATSSFLIFPLLNAPNNLISASNAQKRKLLKLIKTKNLTLIDKLQMVDGLCSAFIHFCQKFKAESCNFLIGRHGLHCSRIVSLAIGRDSQWVYYTHVNPSGFFWTVTCRNWHDTELSLWILILDFFGTEVSRRWVFFLLNKPSFGLSFNILQGAHSGDYTELVSKRGKLTLKVANLPSHFNFI